MFDSARRSKAICGLLLIAMTVVLYSPAIHHAFLHYDDDRYVTDNPQVQAGLRWTTISWAFTTSEQANWHPLTWISHALDCQLFHLNPAAHHFTSILLHTFNVLLLFFVLAWFTASTGRSFFVAALFALHPLNVESVAWVAERKSVLSMLFLLLALTCYGWYVKKPGIGRYLGVAGLFVAGLMCKPMVITLPFLLLLLDYWPLGRMRLTNDDKTETHVSGSQAIFSPVTESFARLCLEKIPLLLLAVASAIVTMVAQRAGGAVISLNQAPLLLRLENAVLSYGIYIKKMIWPSRLAVLYPYPDALPLWQGALAALFLIGITVAVLKVRKHPYWVVGWFWFLGAMVPMVGLVQVGNQAMADRYAYLPLVGLFLMIVWGAADWAKALRVEPRYLAATGFLVLAALFWATRVQLGYWQDDFKLWAHTLAVTSSNCVAENNFGLALMHQGKRDDAVVHFRRAAAIAPTDPASAFNLGVYAQEQGDIPQALAHYATALQWTPDRQLRVSAYANMGQIYFRQRDYRHAKLAFDSVLKLNPSFSAVVRYLGLIAQKNGEWAEAVQDFSKLVALEPTDINYLLLAEAFHQAGRDNDALWAYQQSVRLSKDINQTREAVGQLEAL